MNCCDTLAKTLLIVFNSIFLACGLGILGVGIWLKLDPVFSHLGKAIQLGTDQVIVDIATWTFIGVGIFVFAIAFAGLIGTIRESKVIMGFYIVCVFFVFAAEASVGIYAGVRKDYVTQTIEKEAAEYLRTNYSSSRVSFISNGFNYVQQQWKCCGVKDFMDYKNSSYIKELGSKLKPNAIMSWACCQTTTSVADAFKAQGELQVAAIPREKCMVQSIAAASLYETEKDNALASCDAEKSIFRCKGCSERLKEWVDDNIVILLGVGVGVGGVQLIIMFLALWFCQSLGRYEKKDNE